MWATDWVMDKTEEKQRTMGKKIAILLPNPCNPDYRVIKHAEFFARAGHEVRIYCRWSKGLPMVEVLNGVTYIRKPITAELLSAGAMNFVKRKLGMHVSSERDELRKARAESASIIKELGL